MGLGSLNGLKRNAEKSQLTFIANRAVDVNICSPLYVGSEVVKPQSNVSNLGIVIDCNLKWKGQIESVVSKIYGVLARLWRLAAFTPRSLRKKLVVMLCLPYINYGDVVLGRLDAFSIRKLQLVLNSCTRYIYSLRKYDSISGYSTAILGCNLDSYTKYRWCIYMYKLITLRKPPYLFDKLSFSRSSRLFNLNIPLHSSTQLNNSFFVQAVIVWNGLPPMVKRATSIGKFKKICFEHFTTT